MHKYDNLIHIYVLSFILLFILCETFKKLRKKEET